MTSHRSLIARAVAGWLVLTLAGTVSPGLSSATPITDGLVLWLDAADPDTLAVTGDGRISRWADKSACGNHAVQTVADCRPRVDRPHSAGGPAVFFDGGDFLNLGRPAVLDFGPGDPFTLAVVYHVAAGQCGTFLAKGGGAETTARAYQFSRPFWTERLC